jgi:hypothetical protein
LYKRNKTLLGSKVLFFSSSTLPGRKPVISFLPPPFSLWQLPNRLLFFRCRGVSLPRAFFYLIG